MRYFTESQFLLEDHGIEAELDRDKAVPNHVPASQIRLLPEALRVGSLECGDAVKFVCGDQNLSYAQIDRCSDRLARRLVANHVVPGDRVLVVLPNSADSIIAFFAIWKARAVVVAVDHCIKTPNLANVIHKVRPTVLIAENAFVERVKEESTVARFFSALFVTGHRPTESAGNPLTLEYLDDVFQSDSDTPLPGGAGPDDLATITFTSGSTDQPKGVMHTHASILACALFTLNFLHLEKDDVVMVPLPLHHVLAFRRFLTCFLAKCKLVLAPDIFVMKQFSQTPPTGLVLVPSACNFLIDSFSSFFRRHGQSVRYIEIGSEPISPERLNLLRTILPNAQIHLTYGLTEGRVGYFKPGPSGSLDRLSRWNDGLEIAVVDENGRSVAPGQMGEILISGSGLFKGYWGDSPEAQANLRKYGFRTGDLGVMDANGHIELMGRMDDIVKINGHKINPREIEAVLRRHPAVAEAVVIGVSSDNGTAQTALHAFVVPRGQQHPSVMELDLYCHEHLELYKVPAQISFCAAFPKTPLGKIQRHLVADSVGTMAS